MTPPFGFSAVVGQQHPIALLKTLIATDKLPHALLFTGDEGVGKRAAARAFAMACNCLTLQTALEQKDFERAVDACGTCRPCKKIINGHHPDIIQIGPLTSVIKIAQIRSLLQTLTLKPNEAIRRVVLLAEAQTMNTQAANALLKSLEEPPDRTLFILIATHTAGLLPTVVSRCRQIPFLPLRQADIKQMLAPSSDVAQETLEAVVGLCMGSARRAKRYSDRRWLDRRNHIVRALADALSRDDREQIKPWLLFSERLSKEREQVDESLEIVTMWLRDLLLIHHAPAHMLNRDCLDDLRAAADRMDAQQVIRQMEAVEDAKTALQSNTNVRLTLDAMALRMADAKGFAVGRPTDPAEQGA